MRILLIALVVTCFGTQARADSKKIDLRSKAGVEAIKGTWRYSDVKLVEVPTKTADGKPTTTYSIEPKAFPTNFDDSKWDVVDPTTLGKPRGGGQVCFAWYRIKITIPEDAAGKSVFFQTVVDDYGEVWVDGKLPRKPGDTGGPIVAGFNAPNRVELKDPAPGKVYSIAIFGINGPISAEPGNRIFLGPTVLELVDK
jgi:gluconolactonase